MQQNTHDTVWNRGFNLHHCTNTGQYTVRPRNDDDMTVDTISFVRHVDPVWRCFVHTGRMNGELKVHCHNAATWKFPSFSGQVACRGLDFHFWDAVDDLTKTDIDMVFDDQRLYMHNASGMFGSVPLTLSGELPSVC